MANGKDGEQKRTANSEGRMEKDSEWRMANGES
jgi:hypothetical protein